MLRWAGAALLLAGCAGLGWSAVRALDLRVSALRSLVEALGRLERELDFRAPPMREWLRETARCSAPPASDFLRACAEGVDELEGRPLSVLWERAAQERLGALKRCDREVLTAVGTVLGRYDADSQRAALENARGQLQQLLDAAAQERRRQGKVYGALGAAAGLFLVILLL